MSKKLNVFILAAGFGERLRPITEHIPKPLLPILGKPVLQSLLEEVSALSVNKIGINLHHKKEDIENWIKQSPFSKKIRLFPEEKILGTGGALKNAEQFLRRSAFLVHNSDIVSDIDLEKLLEFHISSKNIVTLAVHDCPEFNNVVVDERGFLKEILDSCFHRNDRGKQQWQRLAFTGIAVYEPEFLKFLPAGTSSIVDAWLDAVTAGYKIGTLNVSGCCWRDIGTPPAYTSTVIEALNGDGEMVYIHPSAKGCKGVELNGYVVIEEKCRLDEGISLRNCIILPGSHVKIRDKVKNPPIPPLTKGREGRLIENCILGPDFKIELNESEIPGSPRTETLVRGLSPEADTLLIGTGGSDRKYYRIKKDKNTAVLMQCIEGDTDFQRQIEYTRFFLKHSIPVPELIETEPDKMRAIFEDLGDISLYSWLKCPREKKQIEKIYRQVIDILIRLHTVATEYVLDCPLLRGRVFNYKDFRWETEYFIERFVKGIRDIKIKNLSALNDEFHRLALTVDSFPKTVIHRDFQSQNIMITKGGIPRLIDYQGARIGPPAYDVVSILWDPYYYLGDEKRERLLDYYISKMRKIPPHPPLSKGGWGDFQKRENTAEKFNERDFMETLLPCRLQRHMQALGAYGFLSVVKGKKYFLKYVPEGLKLLKGDVTLSKNKYPELYKLVMEL